MLTKKIFTRPFAVFPFVTELAYHAQFATVPPSNYHLFVMCKSTVSWPDFGYFRDFATQLGQKRWFPEEEKIDSGQKGGGLHF